MIEITKVRTMVKKEKEIEIRIWDFIDVNAVNDQLDIALAKDRYPLGVAVDIDYECVSIDPKGNLKLKAKFTLDQETIDANKVMKERERLEKKK